MVGGALLFAQATIVLHAVPGAPHAIAVNAVAMSAGAPLLLVGSLVAGESWSLPSGGATWAALGYLVVVGSVLVFVLYAFLLARWPASRAAYVFVVIPMVTIALSASLDGERLTGWLLAGAGLILAGVYLGALRGGRGTVEPGERRSGIPANEARCPHGGWC
jgi:drug/metabolite transporter (DMT)-like permease